jgi:hypothetical protein
MGGEETGAALGLADFHKMLNAISSTEKGKGEVLKRMLGALFG